MTQIAPVVLGNKAACDVIIEDKLESGCAGAALERCAVVKVGGMFCSNCSSAVERAMNGMKHVVKCEVDLINEKARIQYQSHVGAPHNFCSEIEDIGFEASILEDWEVADDVSLEGARAVIHLTDSMTPEVSRTFLCAQPGVLEVVAKGPFLKVTYDPAAIGSRALLKAAQAISGALLLDPAGEAASRAADSLENGLLPPNLFMALVLTSAIVTVCWLLPCSVYCNALLHIEVSPGLHVKALLMCLLATPVVLIAGRKFHVGAYHSIKSGVWDMNVLISSGTLITFGYSISLVLFMMIGTKFCHFGQVTAPPNDYFEAPCMVITFILVGKQLEHWAKHQTSKSLRDLLALQPKEARLLVSSDTSFSKGADDVEARGVPVELVQLGDTLHVLPGEAAPADGCMVCESGDAEFDESLLTGESRPVLKRKGDFIIGGSKCVSGRAELKVERLGNKTMLSQIASLVERSQTARAPVQQVADTVAHYFVPCVVSLAIATWAAWYFVVYRTQWVPMETILRGHRTDYPGLERLFFVLEHGLTVLLVACPCALGLATPTAVMTASGVAAKYGILVRNGAVPLEVGSKVQRLVLDKTGTLTKGEPTVVQAAAFCPASGELAGETPWQRLISAFRVAGRRASGADPKVAAMAWLQEPQTVGARLVLAGSEEAAARTQQREEAEAALWWAIGSAELSSEHPLAKALSNMAASVVGAPMAKPSSFKNCTGVGVTCSLGDVDVQVGSAKHVLQLQANGCPVMEDWVQAARADGSTVVCLAIDNVPLAAVALRDSLADNARTHVAAMQMSGVEVWMCTGDHDTAAKAVAKEVGIDPARVFSEALPGDKVAVVQKLQEASAETGGCKYIVAMVGDGVNDAPALAAADLGVAIGAGHDVTVEAADIVLVRSELADLVTFFALAQSTLKTIWCNFLWAFLFNLCALPVAAGAFWRQGILMTPQIACCLMLSSSLFVVLSSLSLRRFKPPSSSAKSAV